MALVAVVDSVLSKTIQLEQIDALFAVTKFPARYTYAAAPPGPLDAFTITPTGSPFAYQNSTPTKLDIKVQGGAVSKIEQGRKGTFVDTGHIAGGIALSTGDQLRVTYYVAPTMTAFPLV
jgi:hypothetical protein